MLPVVFVDVLLSWLWWYEQKTREREGKGGRMARPAHFFFFLLRWWSKCHSISRWRFLKGGSRDYLCPCTQCLLPPLWWCGCLAAGSLHVLSWSLTVSRCSLSISQCVCVWEGFHPGRTSMVVLLILSDSPLIFGQSLNVVCIVCHYFTCPLTYHMLTCLSTLLPAVVCPLLSCSLLYCHLALLLLLLLFVPPRSLTWACCSVVGCIFISFHCNYYGRARLGIAAHSKSKTFDQIKSHIYNSICSRRVPLTLIAVTSLS